MHLVRIFYSRAYAEADRHRHTDSPRHLPLPSRGTWPRNKSLRKIRLGYSMLTLTGYAIMPSGFCIFSLAIAQTSWEDVQLPIITVPSHIVVGGAL